jgi:hypothetical protein
MLSPWVSQVPGGGVVAQVDGHETDAGLDEPPREQGLACPIVRAVALDDFGGLAREVEGGLGFGSGDEVEGLLAEGIEAAHGAGEVDLGPEAIHLLVQGAAAFEPLHGEAFRQPEKVEGLVAEEGVVFFPEVAAPGDVGAVFDVQRDVGREMGIVRPVVFGDEGADGGVVFRLGIGARLAVGIGGLHHLIRLVIAAPADHGADQGELVHHGGLLGVVLAEVHAGQSGRDGAERAADLDGGIGFGIPGIDVAGAAGHPEKDHAFVAAHGAPCPGGGGAGAEQAGKGDAGHPGETGLEQTAAAAHGEAFADAGMQIGEGVAPGACGTGLGHGERISDRAIGGQWIRLRKRVTAAEKKPPPADWLHRGRHVSQSLICPPARRE